MHFLAQLNGRSNKLSGCRAGPLQDLNEVDGDIGIIAIELMPISFRVTHAMPDREMLVFEILKILYVLSGIFASHCSIADTAMSIGFIMAGKK